MTHAQRYLDPSGQGKRAWLEEHGTALPVPILEHALKHRELPVCLVSASGVETAPVCRSRAEFDRLCDPRDMRTKRWYHVPVEKLVEAGVLSSDEAAGLKHMSGGGE